MRRQHEQHVERMRREMRGDPDKEARELAEKLQRLDRKRARYLDLAAEEIMERDELRTKLSELEGQRKELEEALKIARNHHRTIKQAERAWTIGAYLLELVRIHFVCSGPEDRRRIYRALRLRADVDREGTISLSGIFNPDVHLPDLVQGSPLDPSEPLPDDVERHKVVVASKTLIRVLRYHPQVPGSMLGLLFRLQPQRFFGNVFVW